MDQCLINIATLRKEYTCGELRRADLTAEPIDLFRQWLEQAYMAKLPDANAMSVSTVDVNGQPYQRLVLLKYFNNQSMVFYTNLGSRKAKHLENNSRISLLFPWHALERQVIVLGHAEHLSVVDSMKYFYSRPRDSQISAWVSRQSSFISTREVLENKFFELKQKFIKDKVPFPSFWGGYLVNIDKIEFWQGNRYRLHDRFIYQRKEIGWSIDRLAP